MKNLYSGEFF